MTSPTLAQATKGHLGLPTSPGCPLCCQHQAGLREIPHLGKLRHGQGREQLGAEPSTLPGRETLRGRDDSSSPAAPAPPCSCRNPGLQAPGRQPAPASCPHLPPACTSRPAYTNCSPQHPHPQPGSLRPRFPGAHLPPRVRATLERCRGRSVPNSQRRCPRWSRVTEGVGRGRFSLVYLFWG